MSKKDKKIEIQVADAKVNVGKDSFEGYTSVSYTHLDVYKRQWPD